MDLDVRPLALTRLAGLRFFEKTVNGPDEAAGPAGDSQVDSLVPQCRSQAAGSSNMACWKIPRGFFEEFPIFPFIIEDEQKSIHNTYLYHSLYTCMPYISRDTCLKKWLNRLPTLRPCTDWLHLHISPCRPQAWWCFPAVAR